MSHHVLSAPSRSVPINSMVLFRPVKSSTSPGNVSTLTYLVPGLLNAAMENHDRFKPSPSSTAVFVELNSMSTSPSLPKISLFYSTGNGCVVILALE